MVISHRAGKLHGNADNMSRIMYRTKSCDCYRVGSELKDLTCEICGGCKFCGRSSKQWSRFDTDVDDVVPFAVEKEEKQMGEVMAVHADSTAEGDTNWA